MSIREGSRVNGERVTSSLLLRSNGYMECPFTLNLTLRPAEISVSTCVKNMSLARVFIVVRGAVGKKQY